MFAVTLAIATPIVTFVLGIVLGPKIMGTERKLAAKVKNIVDQLPEATVLNSDVKASLKKEIDKFV